MALKTFQLYDLNSSHLVHVRTYKYTLLQLHINYIKISFCLYVSKINSILNHILQWFYLSTKSVLFFVCSTLNWRFNKSTSSKKKSISSREREWESGERARRLISKSIVLNKRKKFFFFFLASNKKLFLFIRYYFSSKLVIYLIVGWQQHENIHENIIFFCIIFFESLINNNWLKKHTYDNFINCKVYYIIE